MYFILTAIASKWDNATPKNAFIILKKVFIISTIFIIIFIYKKYLYYPPDIAIQQHQKYVPHPGLYETDVTISLQQ